MSSRLPYNPVDRTHLISQINELLDFLAETEVRVPPFGPKLLPESIRVALEQYREFIFTFPIEDQVKNKSQDELDDYGDWLNAIHNWLRHLSAEQLVYLQTRVETGGSARLALPVIEMVKNMVPDFHKRYPSVSFVPDYSYNYEFARFHSMAKKVYNNISLLLNRDIEWEEYEKKRKEKTKNRDEFIEIEYPDYFFLLKIPYMESGNALLHSLLCHEVGHIKDFCEYEDPRQRISRITIGDFGESSKLREETLEKVKKPENQNRPDVLAFRHQAHMLANDRNYTYPIEWAAEKAWAEILSSWVREYLADIFAVRYLGPAYTFAWREYIEITRITEATVTHPSPQDRFIRQIEQLFSVNMGYDIKEKEKEKKKMLFQVGSNLREVFQRSKSRSQKPEDLLLQIPYQEIEDNWDIIVKTAENHIQYSSFTSDRYMMEAEPAFNGLIKGYALADQWIDKVRYPLTFEGLLNGGWYLRLFRIDGLVANLGLTGNESLSRAYNTLNSLLLQASEAAAVITSWDKKNNNEEI